MSRHARAAQSVRLGRLTTSAKNIAMMRLIAVASLSLFLVGCGSVFGGAPAPSAPIGMYSKAILDEAMSLHQLKLGLSAIELQPITMTMPTPVVVTPTTPPAVPPVIVTPVP